MSTYLLLLAALLLISLVLYFQSAPNGTWKALLPAVFGAGVIYMIATLVLKRINVLSYDLTHFAGADNSGVPYEVILSAFIFPFAGIAIYGFLNSRFPKQLYEKYSLALSNILMGLCIAMIFFAYTKWYPVFIFSLMIITLFLVEYKNKIRFMYRFYRAYLIFVLAYLAVVLTFHASGYMGFNEAHTIRFRLFYVPFESFFFLFSTMLISVWLFELFKKRYKLLEER
jgi:phosphate/sulfate permease